MLSKFMPAVALMIAAIVPNASLAAGKTPALVDPGITERQPKSEGVEGFRVPPGYQKAWTDGRLNVYRGVGTARGDRQMQKIWSDSVPSKLLPQTD